MRDAPAEGEAELRYPIRGTFVGCASAIVQSAKSKAQRVRPVVFFFIIFFCYFSFLIFTFALFI
jgi:hypothetical protein